MQVDLFIPCLMNQFSPDTASNMIKVLEKVGCEIGEVGPDLCCMLPEFQIGLLEDARKKALVFLEKVSASDNYFIVPSGACVGMLRHHWETLLGDDLPKSYYQWQHRVLELSEFLTDVIHPSKLPKAKLEGKAFYQNACTAHRVCGIYQAPRHILENVEGLELIEHNSTEVCCGFNNYTNWKFSKIGYQLSEEKINILTSLPVEYIISTDIECLIHLNHYIQTNRKPIKVLHLADVLVSE